MATSPWALTMCQADYWQVLYVFLFDSQKSFVNRYSDWNTQRLSNIPRDMVTYLGSYLRAVYSQISGKHTWNLSFLVLLSPYVSLLNYVRMLKNLEFPQNNELSINIIMLTVTVRAWFLSRGSGCRELSSPHWSWELSAAAQNLTWNAVCCTVEKSKDQHKSCRFGEMMHAWYWDGLSSNH